MTQYVQKRRDELMIALFSMFRGRARSRVGVSIYGSWRHAPEVPFYKSDRTESPWRKCRLRHSTQGSVGNLHPWNIHKPTENISLCHSNMKVSSIDCRRLRKIIRKECGSCLIVDCRPYFSFSSSSIRGSVNVNLNSVVVRRSRGGPVPLQFIIPDEKALLRLREGSISAVVALDDRTPHLQKLKKDSIAQIVINSLSHLASSASICFLKGE